MKEILGRIIVGMLPGILASVIAITVAWNYLDRRQTGYESRPCAEQQCYAALSARITILENRISKLESSQHPSTSKRFTSDDALAMELRMIKCHNRDDRQKCLLEERLRYERSKK